MLFPSTARLHALTRLTVASLPHSHSLHPPVRDVLRPDEGGDAEVRALVAAEVTARQPGTD